MPQKNENVNNFLEKKTKKIPCKFNNLQGMGVKSVFFSWLEGCLTLSAASYSAYLQGLSDLARLW